MPKSSILHARHLRTTGGDPAGGTTGTGGGGDGAAGADASAAGGKADEPGFPANTPTADMSAEQQVAYWKHQARKHEQRSEARADYDTLKAERDRLKATHQTDADKAIETAVSAARAETDAAARAKYAGQLVAAEFRAALAGKRKPEDVAAIVGGLDLTKFLADNGEVNTDKVTQYAAGLAPAGGQWPDTGQGKRGDGSGPGKGVSAGSDMFAASRGKKTT